MIVFPENMRTFAPLKEKLYIFKTKVYVLRFS